MNATYKLTAENGYLLKVGPTLASVQECIPQWKHMGTLLIQKRTDAFSDKYEIIETIEGKLKLDHIVVDDTHIIEVCNEKYFPRRLMNAQWRYMAEGWGFYKSGNKTRSFKTEQGARNFLAQHGNASYMMGGSMR